MNLEKDTSQPIQRMVRRPASDKSVRDLPLTAKLKDGQIVVEQQTCGIVFSFPAAVWPKDGSKQWQWIERLTPWWAFPEVSECGNHGIGILHSQILVIQHHVEGESDLPGRSLVNRIEYPAEFRHH